MGLEKLSSRAVIGMFYDELAADPGAAWIKDIAMYFTSDQDTEKYPWIGMVSKMREWVGGRQPKGFRDNQIEVANKHFEATLDILVKDLRRDKTGQIRARIAELATRANAHWASLLSTLLINAASSVCYDGQYFFDTDHSEGDSGAQDNDLTVDISGLPASVHGSTTAPSVEEMQQTILKAITAILGFKDDQGEPMNETAKAFRVLTPASLYLTAAKAIALPIGTGMSEQNVTPDMSIAVSMNPRLTWTDSITVFRADGKVKPFIMQEELGIQMKAKAEGSEYEFDNDAHQYGIDSWRNVAYGYWQHSCLIQMT